MKNTIIWIMLALISGALLGKITFNKYKKVDSVNVMKDNNMVYMLKYASFANEDEMYDNTVGIDRYVYIQTDDKITVYISITKTKDNAEKMQKVYLNKNINTTIEKVNIDNTEFIQNLTEYEKLLSVAEDDKSLLIIENQILSCYEQVVVNNE